MLLEANARPGLGIQIANARGCLEEIDREVGEDQENGPADKAPVVGTVGETFRLSA
jgi:hypothetical protein